MKFTQRAVALLMALLMCLTLAACDRRSTAPFEAESVLPEQTETVREEVAPEPTEELEGKEPVKETPTVYQTAEENQAAFDAFIREEFISSLEEDYLAIHQTLLHPEDYGIDISKANIRLGEGITETYLEKAREENQSLKKEFECFRYDWLTDKQQETYRLYEYLLDNAITSTSGEFPYMGGAFTPMSGLQNDIVSLLMEFTFYSLEDVDAYLELMRSIPVYVEEMLEFSRVQKGKGYFMSDSACESTMEYCRKLVASGEDSALLAAILNNLETCDLLTAPQKAQYQKEAKELFLHEIIPAYENIYATIGELKDERNNQMGLSYLTNGKEYYQYLFRSKSASERSVEEAKELLLEYAELCLQNIVSISVSNKAAYSQYVKGAALLEYDGYGSMLDDLETHTFEDFPNIDYVEYDVQTLDPEVAVDGVTAYYVVPPIDSDLEQKIKLNPNAGLDNTLPSTFTVFAHEGLPGHLYQTNYVLQNLEDPFRKTTSIIGYSEGYATYVELIALNYLEDHLEKDLITLEQCYTIFQNCLIALCDIGIHYDGWTVADMQDFMDQYVSIDDVTYIYEQLLGDPAGFQSYYMGCVEFLELRRHAQNKLGGRFNDMEFHKVILEGGDLPFSILKEKVDAYIARAKA